MLSVKSLRPKLLIISISEGNLTSCFCCVIIKLCPTQWPYGLYSPPGSSVHGISQARILEWVAISFSRGSFWPSDWTYIPISKLKSFWRVEICDYTYESHTQKSVSSFLWIEFSFGPGLSVTQCRSLSNSGLHCRNTWLQLKLLFFGFSCISAKVTLSSSTCLLRADCISRVNHSHISHPSFSSVVCPPPLPHQERKPNSCPFGLGLAFGNYLQWIKWFYVLRFGLKKLHSLKCSHASSGCPLLDSRYQREAQATWAGHWQMLCWQAQLSSTFGSSPKARLVNEEASMWFQPSAIRITLSSFIWETQKDIC